MTNTFCPVCCGAGTKTDYEYPEETNECSYCLGTGEVKLVDKGGREAIGVEGSIIPQPRSCGNTGNTGGCGCS